jgi:hypothetical protein
MNDFISFRKTLTLAILLLGFCFFYKPLHAQRILPADKKILKEKEDSLKSLAADIILDSLTESRMRSDSLFTRTLVRALQVKNSFYYPFESVQGVSKLYAPDSTFRIFTWNIPSTIFIRVNGEPYK